MHNPLNNIAMVRYKNRAGDSGVTSYSVGNDSIVVEFKDARIYLYNCKTPGSKEIEAMKQLAAKGRGLATYINKFVRKRYAARLR